MSAAEKPTTRLPSDAQREHLMVQAAKLFYDLERTQTEIAGELGLTRWQVSRLLQEARELGIVRIEIIPRMQRRPDLETALQKAYGLHDAVVVPRAGEDDAMMLESVAKAAGQYLAGINPRPSLVGVSWGRTMAAVARSLPPRWNEGVHVVQMNGAVALRSGVPRTNAVAEDFAAAGPGEATLLPVPAIVGNSATREVLEKDRIVADVIELARSASVLCFSLGGLGRESVLVTSGYLTPREIDGLRQRDAVGDVLGRFIDGEGRIVDPALDERTIGLHLDELAPRDRTIGVSVGASKHRVVVASLRRGYVNVLVTDEATAEYALANRRAEDS